MYRDVWSPVLGEMLTCQQEAGNDKDSFACTVKKGGLIVGHVPRETSKTFWYFIMPGGSIECKITGSKQ